MVSDLTALVGGLLAPALAVDARGRIAAVNDALAASLGVDAAQLVGSELAGWIIDATALPDFLDAATGAAVEFCFRTADGALRDLALSHMVRAPAGGAVLTALDMTPRRTAERALQQEVARYQDMTTAASDWFFELDQTMTRMRLLRRDAASGSVTLTERRTQWPHELVDVTYDPDAFANVIRKMAAREVVRDYVHRQANSDKERYLRSSCMPFYAMDGTFQGYRGVSVDVTAQVLAERALRDSEARLRHSQQHLERAQRVAATGSAERDLVTGAEEWSDEMFRLLGLERASFALTDEIIFALVHEDDRERVKSAIATSRAGKPPPPGEFRIVRPDGEILTLYWETEVLCDSKGVPVRSTSVFKDVTELRGAEKREREMERQLLHAQKLEALGTLAGGVAHDLNNTLVPILALTKVTPIACPPRAASATICRR